MAKRHRTHAVEVLGYAPAEIHFTKDTYIDLYAIDPATGRLKRKKYRLNHIRSAARRKQHARDLCEALNKKLRSGWNPWEEPLAIEKQVTITEACEQFLEEKTRTTKNRSPHSYRGHVKRLLTWCEEKGIKDMPAAGFTKERARAYMKWIQDTRKVNEATFNNYHLFCTIIFNWMVNREYLKENPMKGVVKLRSPQKLRTLITVEERKACMEWFAANRPAMVTVCMWVFHTLLRPRSELMRIRVRDVDLENGVVNVRGTDTKSSRVRRPAIIPAMVAHLRQTSLVNADPMDYVVGKGLVPGPEPSGYNYIGLCWNEMRAALNWGKEKQLYSLRDSGIVQLIADGVELQVVMRQADHQNIETTNRYIQHYFAGGASQIHQKGSTFDGSTS